MVAPLNWGLGHACRCIPIIDTLIDRGHQILLASDGDAGALLRQEYPSLPYFELPSYKITYPTSNFTWHWLRKSPHMIQAIFREHRDLRTICEQHDLDVVISDNRYGMYHAQIHSIIMTHQLNFVFPGIVAKILNSEIQKLIERFDECWIPDSAPPGNLSGALSEATIGIPMTFVGPLSRMRKLSLKTKFDVTVMLSGPEPSRSQLEEELIKLLANTDYKKAFVLGQPQNKKPRALPLEAKVFSHLPSLRLNQVLCSSEIIVSRSGFTSLLDYCILNKKAILIPTPKQPEQAYLAKRHKDKDQFFVPCADLSDFHYGIKMLRSTNPRFDDLKPLSLPVL